MKNFCEKYGVVIVSLLENEDESVPFGNMIFKMAFQQKTVELLLKEEDLD
ncbi:hypothetical protein IJM86_03150 [bacterium]|nr:hypothetical protein [bacterium]